MNFVLQIVVCPFILADVLLVFLRFTDSDYPFGVCNLFFLRTLLSRVTYTIVQCSVYLKHYSLNFNQAYFFFRNVSWVEVNVEDFTFMSMHIHKKSGSMLSLVPLFSHLCSLSCQCTFTKNQVACCPLYRFFLIYV